MEWDNVVWTLVIGGIVLLFVGAICASSYYHYKLKIDNFQSTINDLSEEQKCLHICGFQWTSYLENYKFCLEKCDRISERSLEAMTQHQQ